MDGITWVVAFRDKKTHEVVGPVWFHERERKPTLWAQRACYAGCEYAIMDGKGYGYDKGVPDRILQSQEWHDKESEIDMNQEPTFSNDTMTLKGTVCDGSTGEVYCDVWCAEQGGATEDALHEVDAEQGDTCVFCGRSLINALGKEVQ